MSKLVCSKCGNNRSFYREISIVAKLKVNNKEEDLKMIYDIDKNNIDNYFETIYCAKCDATVKDWDKDWD